MRGGKAQAQGQRAETRQHRPRIANARYQFGGKNLA